MTATICAVAWFDWNMLPPPTAPPIMKMAKTTASTLPRPARARARRARRAGSTSGHRRRSRPRGSGGTSRRACTRPTSSPCRAGPRRIIQKVAPGPPREIATADAGDVAEADGAGHARWPAPGSGVTSPASSGSGVLAPHEVDRQLRAAELHEPEPDGEERPGDDEPDDDEGTGWSRRSRRSRRPCRSSQSENELNQSTGFIRAPPSRGPWRVAPTGSATLPKIGLAQPGVTGAAHDDVDRLVVLGDVEDGLGRLAVVDDLLVGDPAALGDRGSSGRGSARSRPRSRAGARGAGARSPMGW